MFRSSIRKGRRIGRRVGGPTHQAFPESHNGAFVRGSSRLQATLDKVRQLRGLLPICSYCKRIRNDQNDWERVEVYVSEHTDAMFTHGICPACLEIAKAEFYRDEAATETPRGRL